MWIFSIAFIMLFSILVATSLSISHWSSRGIEGVIGAVFVCFIIALIMGVSFYISNVCVSSNVELMLEQVLEDLGDDDQDEK